MVLETFAKLDADTQRIIDLDERILALDIRMNGQLDQVKQQIANWRNRFIGFAAGISLGSGALGAAIAKLVL